MEEKLETPIEEEAPNEYVVNVVIPEACLNGDEICPHSKEQPRSDYNPI